MMRTGRLWVGTFRGGISLVEQIPEEDDIRFIIRSGNLLNNYPLPLREGSLFVRNRERDNPDRDYRRPALLCSGFFRPEEIRLYHNTSNERLSGLSTNDVLGISQTRDGRLWVVTLSGGVNLLGGGDELSEQLNFRHYKATNSPASDLSLSVLEDPDGNLP